MKELYLALGSNLGDRKTNISIAVKLLENYLGCSGELSRLYEFPSRGFAGPAFLNGVIRFSLQEEGPGNAEKFLSALLGKIKAIETGLGRKPEKKVNWREERVYTDRPIDIDILFYGSDAVDNKDLKVPHPLIGERDFVLTPLNDVATAELKRLYPLYFQGK